ncbi:MAG: thymidine phosphorylase [Treponema sp.]|nr:thymidine phosphorylase [Treponema sp.]
MRATDIIAKKRGIFITDSEGKRVLSGNTTLSKEEIEFMVKGCTDKSIPDYQMSSFLMAVFFNGMTPEETAHLTNAMLYSGDVMDFYAKKNPKLHGPFVDKHSTGGVGDKISLPLAPIVAACGLQDPMMSGRALGHTGGTLDKLESIKGYRTNLTETEFSDFIARNNFAMTGQTEKIAPADKILYALRDVTGTVESIPLITASILSKKVAEGSDGLVFDVKYGSGAFMKSTKDAELLASSLVDTVKAMGKKASAFITNMNTPLGLKIGNFLEIEETIDCLKGNGPADVMELTYALGAEMLVLGNLAETPEKGLEKCRKAVESGEAYKYFLKNVEMQGGDVNQLEKDYKNRRSPFKTEIYAEKDGFISIDAYGMGIAGVELGVGRSKTTDAVCPDAGMILYKTEGEKVSKGDLIMEVFGKNEECLAPAAEKIKKALTYNTNSVECGKLIYKKI